MNVAYVSDGRDWGYHIAEGLSRVRERKWNISLIVTTKDAEFPRGTMENLGVRTVQVGHRDLGALHTQGAFDGIDVILFYGWSWIVPKEIVDSKVCICLHPSPLPKYRGGSPLQHQIISGEKESMVSLFRMTERLDAGPIYKQNVFPLDGHLGSILERIGTVGLGLTMEMLDEMASGKSGQTVQDEGKATVYKRRAKVESELTGEKLLGMSSKQMFDFIRALEDPYPNAFVRTTQGLLLLKRASIAEHPAAKGSIPAGNLPDVSKEDLPDVLAGNRAIRCSDGKFILVEKAEIIRQN